MGKGKLIVLEGIDSSGKQAQAEMLHSYLIIERKATIFEFPDYATDTGVMIEEYLRGITNYPQKIINMIYSVNRYEKKADIEYALNDGYIVICDRYFYSNMAYGTDEDNSMEDIMELDKEMPQPDCVLLIDISPEVSQQRNNNRDINEQSLEFLTRVRQNYLDLAKINDWIMIDGEMDKEKIHKSIVSKIESSGILD